MNLYDRCHRYRESIGAPWFIKPWDINLLVIRSGVVGAWDDLVVLCCIDDADRRIVHRVRATGDAWSGEWLAPSHPGGCIYVLDQHVHGGLVLGEHKGRPALRQNAAFECVRWIPDNTIPTVAQLEARAVEHSFNDIRGTHLHNRYSGRSPDKPQTDDSEGCTVSLYRHEHIAMCELVKQQKTYRGSGVVSPTFLKRAARARKCSVA